MKTKLIVLIIIALLGLVLINFLGFFVPIVSPQVLLYSLTHFLDKKQPDESVPLDNIRNGTTPDAQNRSPNKTPDVSEEDDETEAQPTQPKENKTPSTSTPAEPDIPSAQITYTTVPDSVKNYTEDCNKWNEGVNYYCENIYRTNPADLDTKIDKSKHQRLLLYGQYSLIDCPLTISTNYNIAERCYQTAKFVDNWQIPRMASLLGFDIPDKKVHMYFTEKFEDVKILCNTSQPASACIRQGYDIIRFPMLYGKYPFHLAGLKLYGGLYEGLNQKVMYEFDETTLKGCYAPEAHELVHYFNYSVFGGSITPWAEEGFTRLIEYKMLDEDLCPPGKIYTNVYKTENGVTAKAPDFDMSKIDEAEPLTSDLEEYAEGYQCRKGVYMQFSRLLNDDGYGFVKDFYAEINKLRTSKDSDYARALWIGTGKTDKIKKFLNDNDCGI